MKNLRIYLLLLCLASVLAFNFSASAQKPDSDSPSEYCFVNLDSSVAPLHGKRIFYQLTDEEGGTNEDDGRKSPAIITKNLRGERDEFGRLVNHIVVFPCTGAAPFAKRSVASDSSRTPGTWDNFHPGDLRN